MFAVFDGHGGYFVSLICKITFPKVMEYNLQNLFNWESNMDQSEIIKRSLKKSVKDMDEILTSKVGHLLVTFILLN